MTRFRDLPGVDRTNYLWPIISCIHPEHGVNEMAVHCLRSPKGERVLLAFLGHTRPGSPQRRDQVDMVAKTARGIGDVIEPIDESDISSDIALRLAAGVLHAPRNKRGHHAGGGATDESCWKLTKEGPT